MRGWPLVAVGALSGAAWNIRCGGVVVAEVRAPIRNPLDTAAKPGDETSAAVPADPAPDSGVRVPPPAWGRDACLREAGRLLWAACAAYLDRDDETCGAYCGWVLKIDPGYPVAARLADLSAARPAASGRDLTWDASTVRLMRSLCRPQDPSLPQEPSFRASILPGALLQDIRSEEAAFLAERRRRARTRLEIELETRRIDVEFVDAPLPEIVARLSERTGVPLLLEAAAEGPVRQDVRVSVRAVDMRLGDVLRWIAAYENRSVRVEEDGVVRITRPAGAR